MLNTCSRCQFFVRESQVLTEPGACYRFPPTMFLFPVNMSGKNGFMPQSAHPIVGPSLRACGEFKSALVIDNTGNGK